MTIDDVRAFHAALMRPADATLVAVGDCEHDAIRRLAAEAFDGWDGAAGRQRAGRDASCRSRRG